MAAGFEPDLVLMDVRIDGPIDGIETARRIRQIRDVPVVFLTAYSDAETLERAKQIEPYGYLVKPFAERDLQAAIEVALHKAGRPTHTCEKTARTSRRSSTPSATAPSCSTRRADSLCQPGGTADPGG